MLKEKLDKILLKVQKPSRYIGGEVNAVVKDKSKVDIRFALPLSRHIRYRNVASRDQDLLYSLKNSVPNYWCERVFMPLPRYGRTDEKERYSSLQVWKALIP